MEIPAQCNGCAFCKCINLKQTIICGNALIKVPISTQGKYVVPKGIEIIAKGAFCDCINITDIIISDSVKRIESLAINGLHNLKSIRISSSVEIIEEQAFYDCGKVESIIVDKNNPVYDSRDSCEAIVETETNKIILGCAKTIISDNIKSIGSYAFAYCSGLKNYKIPVSIEEIGKNAFEFCSNLIEIELSPNLETLEEYVFEKCKKLNKVVIKEGTKFIDFFAFKGCNNLKFINIPNSVELKEGSENRVTFSARALSSIESPIYNNHYFIALPRTYEGKYVVPEGIEVICDDAFNGCKKLTEVTLPDSLKSISSRAFNL